MSEEYTSCWVHQDCHVVDEQKAALKKAAGVSGGKDERQVRLKGREHDDDDCFYYHSWRNNVVIAFGTLSSFLT